MKIKDKIHFVLSGIVCIALLGACSTKKNTATTRAYHALTTRYNVFFNANEAYKESLKANRESFQDNFSEILPFYPRKPLAKPKQQPGGAFDRTIEKTDKAIQLHSISEKPPRNPSKRGDEKYKAWLKQGEFNPFLENAWLLMGKAQIQNQDYTAAISTFSHIIRLYPTDENIVSEAQLWMMRAYIEMGWFFEAEDLVKMLEDKVLIKRLRKYFTENKAHLLFAKKEYAEAIPYMRQTIKKQSNHRQKMRLQYLLGQMYTTLGKKEDAYLAFDKVQGIRTPYDLTFNAIIRQSEVYAKSKKQQIIRKLQRMVKSSKNKEYLDQLYYAIGNIYMSQNDTLKAIENYKLAEKESTRNAFDKALAQIALGDLYFEKKEYLEAEPRYTGALSGLPEHNENYPRVSYRSEVLKKLTPYVAAVEEQDSVQHLAKLPQAEQLKIIEKHIAEIKKREKETKNDANREAYLAEQLGRTPQLSHSSSPAKAAASFANRGGGESSFYFYNMQLVSQGKSAFQQRWGKRKLEDNWRLRKKPSDTKISLVEDKLLENNTIKELDSEPKEGAKEEATDPYSIEFYLQQLPSTPERLKASNTIIEEGLLRMGNIIKDDLNDYMYAISIYNRLLTDFSEGEYNEHVYRQLYMIYSRLGNHAMTRIYKNKLLVEFPESDIAIAMQDSDFEWNMSHFAQVQDSLYQKTYQAYKKGKTKIVRNSYEEVKRKLPNSDFLSKFALLNALSYAQTGNQDAFKGTLSELTKNHPDSDASKFAQEMLTRISEGKLLASTPHAMSDINWNMASSESTATENDSVFSKDKNVPYLFLLMYPQGTLKKNELLFAVANFNFSNFKLRAFDLSFVDIAPLEILQIKGFKSFVEVNTYARLAKKNSQLMSEMPANVTPIIISESNFEVLSSGKSLSEYLAFYEENVAQMPINFFPNNEAIAAKEKEPKSGKKATENIDIKRKEKDRKEREIVATIQAKIEKLTLDSIQLTQPAEIKIRTISEEKLLKAAKQKAEESSDLKRRQTITERQKAKEVQLEQKAAEALQQGDEEGGEKKSRAQLLKEREKERKALMKERERELKAREKQRKKELKKRERERKELLKQRERERKEYLKKVEAARKAREKTKQKR